MAEHAAWPDSLAELLAIEPAGDDCFTANLQGGFGGLTLGCATLAAARTCAERSLHSLHVYFLRPVPLEKPVELRVERVKDGRRLAHRRVRVEDDGVLLCELAASFAAAADGVEFQEAGFDPQTPSPGELPTEEEVARREGWDDWGRAPLEWRWVGAPWQPISAAESSAYRAWVRPRLSLHGDRGLQAATLAFLSDYHSHWPVVRRLGGTFEPDGFTSLDTVLWLHRDLPWDDWRLLASEADVAHGGRSFTRRKLYQRDGRLVASMAQEALVAPR
ncbi:MAG: thioesterase family protein [Proteobacteria bacterium]|nr:thioesterase family protein [Pseudomonadota bacterium]